MDSSKDRDHLSADASAVGTARYEARVEAVATRAAAITFAVGGVLAILIMRGSHRPLAGEGSIGSIAAWFSAVAAVIGFAGAFVRSARTGYATWRRQIPRPKRLLDVLALTIATGTLAYFSVLAVANLFQLGFIGLTVDAVGGAVIVGTAAAAVMYVAVATGSAVTSEGLAMLAILVLFTGTMASMLSTRDEEWWQLHFSQLGNVAEVSGYRFNITLIITGAVLTALANFLGHDIQRGMVARGFSPGSSVTLLTWLFAGIGLCLAVAGFVPDAVSVPVHVGAASGMVVVFIAFVWFVLRLPGMPLEVTVLSLLVIGGIVFAALLWVPIGYYNLTGTEFVAGALLFGWLIMFTRAMGAYADPH